MPIDTKTFKRGTEETEVEAKVRQFLFEHEQQAFTVPEIAVEISDPDLSKTEPSDQTGGLTEYQLDMVAVKTALVDLYHRGAIEARLVEHNQSVQKYYRGRG